jgi:hypothetical protein
MDVVDVTSEIVFVADGMLPITSLPNTLVAFRNLASRSQFWGWEQPRKPALDKAPARWEIEIFFWQGPDRVQMVRQYADRNSFEVVTFYNKSVRLAEMIDMPHKKVTRPVGKRYRKEERAARDLCATISQHTQIVGMFWQRGQRREERHCPPYTST